MRACACGRTHPTKSPTGPARCATVAATLRANLALTEEHTVTYITESFLETLGLKARARRKMSAEGLQARLLDAQQDIAAGRSLLDRGEAKLEQIRGWAAEDGLTKELRALEQPPVAAARKPVDLTRVRARESFVTTHDGIDYAPAPGQIVDVPTAIVGALVELGRVEHVDAATPTTRPPVTAY
jgi:hypothetical protein